MVKHVASSAPDARCRRGQSRESAVTICERPGHDRVASGEWQALPHPVPCRRAADLCSPSGERRTRRKKHDRGTDIFGDAPYRSGYPALMARSKGGFAARLMAGVGGVVFACGNPEPSTEAVPTAAGASSTGAPNAMVPEQPSVVSPSVVSPSVVPSVSTELQPSGLQPSAVPDDAVPDSSAQAQVCPGPTPMRLPGHDITWTLPVALRVGGAPLVLGEEVTRSDGTPWRLSLLKFFLAEPTLHRADGTTARAQFVDESGAPLAYELALVDADLDNTLRLSAPSGEYRTLAFGVGVPAVCNQTDPTTGVFPLSTDGGMYWSWGFQYTFSRVEGHLRLAETWEGFTYHFGLDICYRVVTSEARLQLSGNTSTAAALTFDVEAFLTPPTGIEAAPGHLMAPAEWMLDNLVERTFELELVESSP